MAFSYLKRAVSNQMLDAYVQDKDRLDLNFIQRELKICKRFKP